MRLSWFDESCWIILCGFKQGRTHGWGWLCQRGLKRYDISGAVRSLHYSARLWNFKHYCIQKIADQVKMEALEKVRIQLRRDIWKYQGQRRLAMVHRLRELWRHRRVPAVVYFLSQRNHLRWIVVVDFQCSDLTREIERNPSIIFLPMNATELS